ncbi:MAG TPA: hypothetical protein VMR70_06195 [Flavisolibacter sp.]|nr:hypothetical protein [Flavisolibacter sp.]
MNLQLTNTKHFNYWLTGTGWAEATFANENQSVTFEVSYLSDPLWDMFEALYRLLTEGTKFEKIVFAGEPGEHVLTLAIQSGGTLNIEILWNDDWEELAIQEKIVADNGLVATNKEVIYKDTDTVENFCLLVCQGIDDLLRRTSIEEYKKQWRLYDFPLSSFNQLKQQLPLTIE